MADSPETQAPEQAAAPSGIKARLPLMVAIIVGLAVGVGTGAVVVGPAAAKALGFGVVAVDSAATDSTELAEGDSAAAGAAAPALHTLDNLALNPAGSGGTRFLLLTLTIECANAAGVTALQTRDAELSDVVLSTLGGKTVEELTDITLRDSIKVEVQNAINERFGKKTVLRVYFPKYVVQ